MRRFPLSSPLLAAALTLGLVQGSAVSSAAAAEVTVVASIKPINSLVAAVMQGAGSPHLIVQGGNSPHSYSLKPSDAAALQQADVVVWIGEGLETFLESPIETLSDKAVVVELAEAPGLTLLQYRAGGAWEKHEHNEDDHDAHAEAEHDHAHEEHAQEEHAEADDDHEHDHGDVDMHLWLDPENAKAIVAALAEVLTEVDPDNSGIYRANAKIMDYRLNQLTEEIEHDLAPVKDVPFVVFHDAYQYLDRRFALNNVGSITVDPERKPGARRLKEIQAKIQELDARCVFAEPQFEPQLLQVVIEGTDAKTGLLDPLGADLTDGPELYFELLRRNAKALKECLGETS